MNVGNRVLVTGAGRGIGLATARAFASAGWDVISLDKEFGEEVIGAASTSIYATPRRFVR